MPKNQTYVGYELQRVHLTYGGYRFPVYLTYSGDGLPSDNLNGLTLSNTVRAYKWLGVEGNASVGYKSFVGYQNFSDANVENFYFMGGPRLQYSLGRFAPYGHFLLGIDRLHMTSFGSVNAFAIGVGGGASVYLTKHFGLSGGIDYAHASKDGIGLNAFKVTGGPVFTWGGTPQMTAHQKGHGALTAPSAALIPAPQVVSTPPPTQPKIEGSSTLSRPKVVCLEVQVSASGDAVCTHWKQAD
jgi:hypothetical protein